MNRFAWIATVSLCLACTAPGAAVRSPSPPTPSGTITPEAATSSPTPSVAMSTARVTHLDAAGDFALLSPDGTRLASVRQSSLQRTYVIEDLRGNVLREYVDTKAAGRFEWLPDSSGILLELASGQRAGPLGLLTVAAGVRDTGLDYANVAISRDRKWIAAERQEGCCVAIRIREIRVAPLTDAALPRTLVTTSAPESVAAPIALLGWDGDSLVFRDGARLFRTTLEGDRTELSLPQSAAGRSLISRGTSQDGRAILACAADPQRFWIIVAGVVNDLPSTLRPSWPTNDPFCGPDSQTIPWIGEHELVLRDPSGALVGFDALTRAVRTLSPSPVDAVLAASDDVLLISIKGEIRTIALATGEQRRVDVAAAMRPGFTRPISGGRFFAAGGAALYLIG